MVSHDQSSIEQSLEFLRRSEPWSALSEEAMRSIALSMRLVVFEPEQTVIHQGAPGRDFHIILSGRMEVRVETDSGSVIPVATLGEKEAFGEMSLLTGDTTSANVVAIERSRTLALDRESFETLTSSQPSVLREFVRVLSKRLRVTDAVLGKVVEKEKELSRFVQNEKAQGYDALIGRDRAMNSTHRQIKNLSQESCPVLIEGERGAGKESVGRRIHALSVRKEYSFVSVNAEAAAETALGDTLFGPFTLGEAGHRRHSAVCYIDLAEGGTLLLRNIESLTQPIQKRLAQMLTRDPSLPAYLHKDVRVMATIRGSLEDLTQCGRILPELAALFTENRVTVPALRERKRDIPELARHFLTRHAERLKKRVTDLDDSAITKLVSYHFTGANVQELKEAIELAVVLTDEEVIAAEAVFLGTVLKENHRGVNLLNLPRSILQPLLRFFPTVVQAGVGLFFALILILCFFGTEERGGRLATFLVWSLWWPGLVFSFFFLGRLWCAICPMALSGSLAQRVVNLKWHIPAWIKNHDSYLAMGGFVGIMWLEAVSDMHHSPVATGFLLIGIMSCATIASVVFPRRTWCRYLCPMGGFGGLCSTASVLELRPTLDLCSAKCAGHACYKGTESSGGCPVFNHLMFQDSNSHCVLCLECVRSCPNGSPQLNLRFPGRELWTGNSELAKKGWFTMLLLGLLIGLILLQNWESIGFTGSLGAVAEHRFWITTAVLVCCTGLPLGLLRVCRGRMVGGRTLDSESRFWKGIIAFVPLVVAGYAAYEIGFVPELIHVEAGLSYQGGGGAGGPAVSLSLLSLFRALVLMIGLSITVRVLWKHFREEIPPHRPGPGSLAMRFACACVYCGLLLFLM